MQSARLRWRLVLPGCRRDLLDFCHVVTVDRVGNRVERCARLLDLRLERFAQIGVERLNSIFGLAGEILDFLALLRRVRGVTGNVVCGVGEVGLPTWLVGGVRSARIFW